MNLKTLTPLIFYLLIIYTPLIRGQNVVNNSDKSCNKLDSVRLMTGREVSDFAGGMIAAFFPISFIFVPFLGNSYKVNLTLLNNILKIESIRKKRKKIIRIPLYFINEIFVHAPPFFIKEQSFDLKLDSTFQSPYKYTNTFSFICTKDNIFHKDQFIENLVKVASEKGYNIKIKREN